MNVLRRVAEAVFSAAPKSMAALQAWWWYEAGVDLEVAIFEGFDATGQEEPKELVGLTAFWG